MIHKSFIQKIKLNRIFYVQILFVVIAFIAMVALGSIFMSNIVRKSMVRNAESVLDTTKMRIVSWIEDCESTTENFADEISHMMQNGQNDSLKSYINDITQYIFLYGSDDDGVRDFFLYDETQSEGSTLIYSDSRLTALKEKPMESDWYRLAVEADGELVETTPYMSDSGEVSYIYAKCILDEEGNRLGVAGTVVIIEQMGQEIVGTALNQGGYGMLMNQDLITLFHPNTAYVGIRMEDPDIPVHIFADDLRSGKEIFEQPLNSFKNEKSVAFFRALPNGWHLGLVTPNNQYYANMYNMVLALSLLGIILMLMLIGILVRIDKARSKSDDENKKKSMFLANMSHEIRTPLNAVIGLSELAMDSDRLELDLQDKLEKIHTAGTIILSIVNDILDISKLESGKFEMYPTHYDTPSLINDIVTFNIVRIGEKPITLQLDVDERLPCSFYGDDLRVKQIFNNLLSNALKYTDAGTVEWRITFERDQDSDSIWIVSSVRDTGIGIKAEDIKKLFAEYNQVDVKANRKVEGTGLGLAIAKNFVEMMDGTISVESEYGKGTVFHVRFRQEMSQEDPIGKEVASNLMELRYTLAKHGKNRKMERINLSYAHVLVVDDILTNLDVAKGMMRPYGLKVDCATSGQQAVDMIKAENPRYNAVFMDYMMPGMDGIEATKIIRQEIGTDYAKNIPIITLTANAIVGNEEMFLAQGFQDFISKPIDIGKLDTVLRHWVRDKKLEKRLVDTVSELVETTDDSADRAISILNAEAIDGLDMHKALERFSGNEAALSDVLGSYTASTPALLTSLHELLMAGKLADYSIVIHGIKGSSYGIFAQQVAQAAADLEIAAKAEDLATVRAAHPDFERAAAKLIHDIQAVLDTIDAAVSKPAAAEPDPALLQELRAASAAFDMDRVDAVMEQLEALQYERGAALIVWLREQVDNMTFEEISDGEWPSE
jgi:signal transduction histidine kinase/DNA-binding response OmpR family regulator/HPt (histidine-containing phosphotransfer) domain-containing protein